MYTLKLMDYEKESSARRLSNLLFWNFIPNEIKNDTRAGICFGASVWIDPKDRERVSTLLGKLQTKESPAWTIVNI